ncbi:hypothetical protein AAG906_013715 [Vitis piasezkii]
MNVVQTQNALFVSHAEGILYALKEKGIDMAIASRSPTLIYNKHFGRQWVKYWSIKQGLKKFSQNSASSGNTKRN